MTQLKNLLLAFIALALLGTVWAPIAYADGHEESEEVMTVVEEIGYDPIPALIGMRDAEAIMVRMAGVLDRYDGNGHPEDCDDYVLYMVLLLLFDSSFGFEALFAPSDWEDVMLIAQEATQTAFSTNESIFYLCQNGGNDSISSHNLYAGRAGIEEALEQLRGAIRASANRLGIDPESIPSSIGEFIDVEPDPAEIEFIADLLGLNWDSEVFYEDLRITEVLLQNIGGWLDRLIAGETVGCGEYIILMQLSISPVPFLSMPDVWEPLFNEHVAIINSILDANKELIDVCVNGGNINEFMVFKARDGVAKAGDRLHALKQETERRLDITPQ